jgi:uncharacterized protein UPF0158
MSTMLTCGTPWPYRSSAPDGDWSIRLSAANAHSARSVYVCDHCAGEVHRHAADRASAPPVLPVLAGRRRIYSGLVLDLSSLDLEEIGNALADQTDYEHRWLINPKTGEIAFWTADTGIDGQTPVDLDELDLVCIDPLPSWVWYQDMADFAETITDERAGRRLARAIQGKGAFRRFRDELHDEYPDLLPAWYAFRDVRAMRRAVQWLGDNSLIDDDAASRFLAGHPDPDLP